MNRKKPLTRYYSHMKQAWKHRQVSEWVDSSMFFSVCMVTEEFSFRVGFIGERALYTGEWRSYERYAVSILGGRIQAII